MSNFIVNFSNAKQLGAFIAKARACSFGEPFCGECAFMVSFTVSVKCAESYILDLADRIGGVVYSA